MKQVVFDHGGSIEKFIGDAVMAFWNAPLADPDHALHSVRAACAMQQAMPDLNRTLVADGLPALGMRIGVHTGQVLVGNMGSRIGRLSYTALGDAVNLASRLEGANKAYGTGHPAEWRHRRAAGGACPAARHGPGACERQARRHRSLHALRAANRRCTPFGRPIGKGRSSSGRTSCAATPMTPWRPSIWSASWPCGAPPAARLGRQHGAGCQIARAPDWGRGGSA